MDLDTFLTVSSLGLAAVLWITLKVIERKGRW